MLIHTNTESDSKIKKNVTPLQKMMVKIRKYKMILPLRFNIVSTGFYATCYSY